MSNEFEDFDDELDDYPDDWDDDEPETFPCPECGAEVYEDSPHCPVCGAYVTFSTNPWLGRSWWWVLLGALGILGTLLALAGLRHF